MRILPLVAVLTAAISVTACGNDSKKPASDPNSSGTVSGPGRPGHGDGGSNSGGDGKGGKGGGKAEQGGKTPAEQEKPPQPIVTPTKSPEPIVVPTKVPEPVVTPTPHPTRHPHPDPTEGVKPGNPLIEKSLEVAPCETVLERRAYPLLIESVEKGAMEGELIYIMGAKIQRDEAETATFTANAVWLQLDEETRMLGAVNTVCSLNQNICQAVTHADPAGILLTDASELEKHLHPQWAIATTHPISGGTLEVETARNVCGQ